ncbi:uncharacterized protein LOC124620249 [Schistocerca americana]|uniref:uncharacterized protein LOC124620249 n=1 Tax=Schistocerca americana TaxID=7009 RepID=UPI001F502E0F|nr:uncharacterized protein LOC124620249 [Schistocerca americana]
MVVNLSSHTLSEATTAILAKGMNFAVAPKRVPKEDIIESVEASVRHLPQAEAEKIRQETVRVLNKAKPPKQNINAEEYHTIKELRDNHHLVVVQADKGNATEFLDTTDYNKRMEDILAEAIYKKLQGNPTAKGRQRRLRLRDMRRLSSLLQVELLGVGERRRSSSRRFHLRCGASQRLSE